MFKFSIYSIASKQKINCSFIY